jgi:dTDP-4-dehydrorhamnose 3,5-epimerase
MKFVPALIAGAWTLEPERIEDERGYFARTWSRNEFAEHGIDVEMVQGNTGYSNLRGTVRGMHWQQEPHQEVKLIRCIAGRIFDVVVDMRVESPTYLSWFGAELSKDNGVMMLVPSGCAHGYQTLADAAEISYLTSAFYEPSSATGVRWDDPRIGVRWPVDVTIVSERDRSWPLISSDRELARARERG